MALANVTLQYQYFADPARGRPIALGSVFVGIVDTDPETPANQLTIIAKQEDGTEVPISQPVSLSAGGVPQLNGSPIRILVDGAHSLKVLDSGLNQVYYLNDSIEGTQISPFGEILIAAEDADAARVIMNSMEKIATAVTNNIMIFDASDEAKDSGVQFVRSGQAAGAADLLTVDFTIPVLALTDGLEIRVRSFAENATTTPTINIDGLGAVTIVKYGDQALASGDTGDTGNEMILKYNSANANIELLNPVITLVVEEEFASGVQTITSGGLLTIAHGLSSRPFKLFPYLVCTTADGGYEIGDEVFINTHMQASGSTSRGIAMQTDGINITVRFGSDAQAFVMLNEETGTVFTATNARWEFRIRAFL